MRDVTNQEYEVAFANTNYQRIISSVFRKYRGLLPSDEIKFRRYMALYHCLQQHDPDKGRKFESSLRQHTIWQCKKALRDNLRHPPLPELQFEYELTAIIPPEISYVRDCLENLNPVYSHILVNYYLQGMTLKEIGDMNGYTAPAAMQKLRQAETAFRRLYGDD